MSERLIGILTDAFPKLLSYGLKVTVPLTALSFALALVISIVVAVIQYADIKVLRQACRFYIWIIRGTPLLVQLYLVFYGLPSIGIVFEAFPAAVLVFGINEGAYMAESVRAALEAIPKDQLEAGLCQGVGYLKIMRRIMIPQAARIAFPSLMNSLISMLKGTSLASCITVTEMFREAQVINGRVYESLALYTEVALIYLMICTVLTLAQKYIEKKLKY